MRILCAFGKHQYGDSSRGLSTEYFSFYESFAALGHEVSLVDIWDKSLYEDSVNLNESLVKVVESFKPDLIFVSLLLFEVWMETFEFIKKSTGCTLIHWCSDDSWKFEQQSRYIASYFDYMITTYPEFETRYKELGTKVIVSGWGCPDAWLRTPESEQIKYDVSFVGTAHGDRKEYIKNLKNFGIEVECFGKGWPSGPVDAGKIPSIFNQSRINLNFANSVGDNQIKARTFEVPGSGGFLLTDYTPGLEDVFEIDRELVTFKGIKECSEKIKYFLNSNEERSQIANNGYRKVLSEYSYKKRMKTILEQVNCDNSCEEKDYDFDIIKSKYHRSLWIKISRYILISIGRIVYGKDKGPRFARRLAYEISWRFFGKKMYSVNSIIGRMFYAE